MTRTNKQKFQGDWHFLLSAFTPNAFPPIIGKEIAFLGRSNVGKSSLINALTGQKSLARSSKTPGRTASINFFQKQKAFLVDLPGYGWVVNPSQKSQWEKTILHYLIKRPTTQNLFVLLDARHTLKPSDHHLMTLLHQQAIPFQVILTKIDKLPHATHHSTLKNFSSLSPLYPSSFSPPIYLSSATEKIGVPTLRRTMNALLFTHLPSPPP